MLCICTVPRNQVVRRLLCLCAGVVFCTRFVVNLEENRSLNLINPLIFGCMRSSF